MQGEVYPRVCGGTTGGVEASIEGLGLSPRVRGNLRAAVEDGLPTRSIPACAGEPYAREERHQAVGVYPRVCGGTGMMLRSRYTLPGLSPRVRGNHAGLAFQ